MNFQHTLGSSGGALEERQYLADGQGTVMSCVEYNLDNIRVTRSLSTELGSRIYGKEWGRVTLIHSVDVKRCNYHWRGSGGGQSQNLH